VLHWGDPPSPGTSDLGTIWAEGATVHARTGLAAARVPFRARTHGFADHPDVVVAA
jgi:hypothetical protein